MLVFYLWSIFVSEQKIRKPKNFFSVSGKNKHAATHWISQFSQIFSQNFSDTHPYDLNLRFPKIIFTTIFVQIFSQNFSDTHPYDLNLRFSKIIFPKNSGNFSQNFSGTYPDCLNLVWFQNGILVAKAVVPKFLDLA